MCGLIVGVDGYSTGVISDDVIGGKCCCDGCLNSSEIGGCGLYL